jgi:hypothetical protein
MPAHINFNRTIERANTTLHTASSVSHHLTHCAVDEAVFLLSKKAHTNNRPGINLQNHDFSANLSGRDE